MFILLLIAVFFLSACIGDSAPTVTAPPVINTPLQPNATHTMSNQAPEILVPRVIREFPHDTAAFTQGLVFYPTEGTLYESTGLYGQSTLRQLNPETGEVIRSIPVAANYFAEGLALVDDRLIQLTWQEKEALVYDRVTFELLGTFPYETEGWGLCYDGIELYMSDGSSSLFVRDPQTFELRRTIPVTAAAAPVTQLNELECVGSYIYANVWLTDQIMRIDKTNGQVTAIIDASGLLTPEERNELGSGGTLNGIAFIPANNSFLITGKLFPKMFEVHFVSPE
ncbi:MAG: glutaminyl-peptide cyclotransferase [Anaerolineae bacterium]|jgi:glutamine cyclotransferase|nr:glutaminyl-peptide cyclotransferase [Anaerolineae bacterium]